MSLPQLLEHLKKTAALGHVAGLMMWDQRTKMPAKGAVQRADQTAALASVIHGCKTDPRIPEWIAGIDQAALSPADRRNVAEAQRSHDRATKIPVRLAEETARAVSQGQRQWRDACKEGDFAVFAPALKRTIALKREEARCLAAPGAALYDCLLDGYEPGAKAADVMPLLEGMRPALLALSEKIAGKPEPEMLNGQFPAEAQLALARTVAARFGYDFRGGRLDSAVRAFCFGIAGDVRVTMRTNETDPFHCLFSTVHEVGHALYAQGACDPFLPAADYCSMAVHESQARFWENQIARSRAFAGWLHPAMERTFGALSLAGPDALYAAINRMHCGFIRTNADEVHYNLHILLRVGLERELISGALEVEDLEAAWNERFLRDFGRRVPDPGRGVLQDVHWSIGYFGYFPTYSLGNIYAACLDAAMCADLPDRDAMVGAAETQPILDWLRRRIHVKGRLLTAPRLIEEATGRKPTAAPLIAYLEEKFGALYDL